MAWHDHIELEQFEIDVGTSLNEKMEAIEDAHDRGECVPMFCPVCASEVGD